MNGRLKNSLVPEGGDGVEVVLVEWCLLVCSCTPKPTSIYFVKIYPAFKMHFIIFVFVAVMFAACVQAGTTVPTGLMGNLSSSNCGGNCPGGCSSCPCGTSTNYQDINSWCSKYSWNQVNIFFFHTFQLVLWCT